MTNLIYQHHVVEADGRYRIVLPSGAFYGPAPTNQHGSPLVVPPPWETEFRFLAVLMRWILEQRFQEDRRAFHRDQEFRRKATIIRAAVRAFEEATIK